MYAGPYLAMSEGFGLVLTRPDDGTEEAGADVVGGYVLGTADTLAFEAQCERLWWPPLRDEHPLRGFGHPAPPDAELVDLLHHPQRTDPQLAREYPAHLHVDVLPEAQGGGNGRRLIAAFLDALRERGCPGVHLGAAAANTRAIGFYEHLGFQVLEQDPHVVLLGQRLA